MLNEFIQTLEKRVYLFSLFFLSFFSYSQVFIRNSDQKKIDSVYVLQNNRNKILNRLNFRDYQYKEGDKIVYDGKIIDFYKSNDTLILFDKYKEIEEVQLVNIDVSNKIERSYKSDKANATADIFTNNLVATSVRIKNKKKAYVKSVTFFPETRYFKNNIQGMIKIEILPSINGLPDKESPLLSFERNISDCFQKKWEIQMPRIIKYPEDGFFVSFYFASKDKKSVVLRLDKNSNLFFYHTNNHEWKKAQNSGYLYKLKIFQ